jgi:hypothetical protein
MEKREIQSNWRYKIMNNIIINQLKNLFAAMPFAEAGDLDSVKQILRQNPCTPATEQDAEATVQQQPAVPMHLS